MAFALPWPQGNQFLWVVFHFWFSSWAIYIISFKTSSLGILFQSSFDEWLGWFWCYLFVFPCYYPRQTWMTFSIFHCWFLMNDLCHYCFFHKWSSSCLILYEWCVSYVFNFVTRNLVPNFFWLMTGLISMLVVLYFGCCYPCQTVLPSQGMITTQQNFHPNVCLVLQGDACFLLPCIVPGINSFQLMSLFLPMLFRASWWVYPRIVIFAVDAFALHALEGKVMGFVSFNIPTLKRKLLGLPPLTQLWL